MVVIRDRASRKGTKQMHDQLYQDIYASDLTHWWFRARRRIVASLLRRFAPPARRLRTADIGCGMGGSFDMLAEFGWVVGAEMSPMALSYCRSRTDKPLLAAALPRLPFHDASFDIVTVLDVIEHIDDDHGAVRELWRICKPGGLLVVTVPALQWLWSEHDDINEHKRRYHRAQLRACLGQGSVEFLKLSYMNTVLAPPLMAVRLLKNLARRGRPPSRPLQSDVSEPPPLVNRTLERLFASESLCLKWARLRF